MKADGYRLALRVLCGEHLSSSALSVSPEQLQDGTAQRPISVPLVSGGTDHHRTPVRVSHRPQADHNSLNLGFMISPNPSPSKLNPSATMAIIMPGKVMGHQ